MVFFWPFLFFYFIRKMEAVRPPNSVSPLRVLCYFNHAEWHIITGTLHVNHTPFDVDHFNHTRCTFGLLYHPDIIAHTNSGFGLCLHHCASITYYTLQFGGAEVPSLDCLFDICCSHAYILQYVSVPGSVQVPTLLIPIL